MVTWGMGKPFVSPTSDAVHDWFSLTYASYLVLPRVLLQSMPVHWQRRFVKMLKDLDNSFSHVKRAPSYWVRACEGGRFIHEDLPGYRHGYVEPKLGKK
jgi:hypothetical protein